MKILIAVAGKTGTALKCGALLARLLPGAQVADLELDRPDPAAYDAVIVGGAVRMGQLHRKARAFLEQNEAALLTRPFGCFVCCAFAGRGEEYLQKNIPPALLAHAAAARCVGGELDPKRLNGMDKFIVGRLARSMEKEARPAPALDADALQQLAQAMGAALGR